MLQALPKRITIIVLYQIHSFLSIPFSRNFKKTGWVMSMFEDMDGIGAYKKGFGTRVRKGANDRKVDSIGI